MGSNRATRFSSSMLNGHPGNIARAVRRVIVRGFNHNLLVTFTTDGQHAARSWHKILPPRNFRGRAVDFGHRRPGTAEARADEVAFQKDLLRVHGAVSFHELFGPDNAFNVKEGVIVSLGEGTPLETMHDTHVHVAPRLLIPLPTRTREEIEKAKRRRRRRRNKRIARSAGAHFVSFIFDSADKHNVSKALALALFEQESGFRNVVGHDRNSRGQLIPPAQAGTVFVTETLYRAYKLTRARNGAQGIGPGQLTSPGFQDLADQRGGCFKPEVNIDVSLEILAGHIKALGTFNGVGAYNGGRGNPNEDYARRVLALRDIWAGRLR